MSSQTSVPTHLDEGDAEDARADQDRVRERQDLGVLAEERREARADDVAAAAIALLERSDRRHAEQQPEERVEAAKVIRPPNLAVPIEDRRTRLEVDRSTLHARASLVTGLREGLEGDRSIGSLTSPAGGQRGTYDMERTRVASPASARIPSRPRADPWLEHSAC